MTLQERVQQLIERHGGLRKAARVVQIDPAYLSRLHSGEKVRPLAAVLKKLDLRRIVTYERINS